MNSQASLKGFELQLIVSFFKEGDFIVAYSPELELSSYGKSESEALAAFKDAIEMFIKDSFERGTLFGILKELGWKISKVPNQRFAPPKRRASHSPLPDLINTRRIPVRMPAYSM